MDGGSECQQFYKEWEGGIGVLYYKVVVPPVKWSSIILKRTQLLQMYTDNSRAIMKNKLKIIIDVLREEKRRNYIKCSIKPNKVDKEWRQKKK